MQGHLISVKIGSVFTYLNWHSEVAWNTSQRSLYRLKSQTLLNKCQLAPLARPLQISCHLWHYAMLTVTKSKYFVTFSIVHNATSSHLWQLLFDELSFPFREAKGKVVRMVKTWKRQKNPHQTLLLSSCACFPWAQTESQHLTLNLRPSRVFLS